MDCESDPLQCSGRDAGRDWNYFSLFLVSRLYFLKNDTRHWTIGCPGLCLGHAHFLLNKLMHTTA